MKFVEFVTFNDRCISLNTSNIAGFEAETDDCTKIFLKKEIWGGVLSLVVVEPYDVVFAKLNEEDES